jgi:LysM repeat protein
MSRLISMLCAVAAPATGFAAEPSLTQEVHELRRDMQLQSRQIETLTQQVAKLTQLIQDRDQAKTVPEPAQPPAPAAAAPAAKPATEAPAEIPKAEAVPPPIQHVVEKGETLTSIAKHYNIPLPDLQKLNKITNDRKLQIGQTLAIPAPKTPETKTPEPPSEKKQNP